MFGVITYVYTVYKRIRGGQNTDIIYCFTVPLRQMDIFAISTRPRPDLGRASFYHF